MLPPRSRRLPSTLLLAIVLAVTAGFASPVRADDAALPRPELLQRALGAYHRVEQSGMLRTRLLTVIDYSLPSWTRRLWVVDPAQPARVLFHEFVAHGRGSTDDDNPDYAVRFGNDPASLRSSLGAFLTGATYTGSHGRSLELYGLDQGVNDRAFERKIVMHPADYVSAAHRAFWGGSVGRSWGCPALDPAVATAVIDRIQNGSLLYVDGAVTAQAQAVGPAQLAAVAAGRPSSGRPAPGLRLRLADARGAAKRARAASRSPGSSNSRPTIRSSWKSASRT